MIYFLLASQQQITIFKKTCAEKNLEGVFLNLNHQDHLDQLYSAKEQIETIVTSCAHPRLTPQAWLDIINAWGARVPVIALYAEEHLPLTQKHLLTSPLLWQPEKNLSAIFTSLQKLTSLGLKKNFTEHEPIPVFNPVFGIQRLQKHNFLSLICIDTSDFRKIAITYGRQTYNRLRTHFQEVLVSLWGKTGSFRLEDKLYHSVQNANLYYIMLAPPRTKEGAPDPGQLEALTERIMYALQNTLWHDIARLGAPKGALPLDLAAIPHFYLGYDTIVHNPCIDPYDAIDMVLQTSRQTALIQQQRIFSRHKEFMQLIIQNEGYLRTIFQGIFVAKKLTPALVTQAHHEGSLKPLKDHLYGFEALTRIDREKVESLAKQRGPFYFDVRSLSPEVLFTMARTVKLSLELDQACLRKALASFENLPGRLMANILPRNFYHIDQLLTSMRLPKHLTFEVAESEAIKNYELLLQAKENIAHKNFGIAIDDFGKGHAGFNRIITIEPHIIKLDRILLQGINKDAVRRSYVGGIVKAAAVKNTLVLAEGVETLAEMQTLQEIGVDLFQGQLFHFPESKEEIVQSMGKSSRRLTRRSGLSEKSPKTTVRK